MYINKTNTLCYTTTINWYIRGGRRRDQRTAEKTCENEKHAKPSRTLSCYLPLRHKTKFHWTKSTTDVTFNFIYYNIINNYYLLNCFGDNIYEHMKILYTSIQFTQSPLLVVYIQSTVDRKITRKNKRR